MPKSKHRRKSKGSSPQGSSRPETAKMAAGDGAAMIEGGAAEPKAKQRKVGPVQFFRQVRDEMQKITWTSRNETMISTIMVLIMVTIASIFFFTVDQILRWLMPMLLSFSF
ncbi:preprotein translocase subunit SecE [Parvularcula marina]|nr:preprotein translocase subunit SecE [Parvularcula marina]